MISSNLINFREVINFMYGSMAETTHLRDRCPLLATWSIAELLVQELDFPCKVVIKAQDQGHWVLSDAIHRCTTLWKDLADGVQALIEEEEE